MSDGDGGRGDGPGPGDGWSAGPGGLPPYPEYGRPDPPQPGVVPLRPLSVGEILDGSLSTMRRYPATMFGLAALVVVLEQLVGVALRLATGGYGGTNGLNAGTVGASTVAITTGTGAAVALVDASLSAVLVGMLTVVVAGAVLGRPVSAASVWERIRPLAPRLVGAALLAGILPYLGLVAFVVGGIFLWGALALTTPALVLEDTTVTGALRRSWRLAVPSWFRVFGIMLLASVIAAIVGALIALPFAAVGTASLVDNSGSLGAGAIASLTAGGVVAGIVTTPFVSGVAALLYLDRRMRAEGLDLAGAAAGYGQPPFAAPGPGR